jgi:hypothetical protein
MRQFPLEDLDLASGHVIEWRLRSTRRVQLPAQTRTEGVGAGTGVSKRASFNQDKHYSVIEETRKANESFASWLAVTFEIAGPLDRPALESALLYLARRHEVLRCEFRRLTGDLSCELLAPEAIALEAEELGEFAPPELQAVIADSFRRNIDTLAWPLFTMGAVVRDGGPTTVFLGFDHLVSDGMSMPNVAVDVQLAYAAFRDGHEPVLPAAGSYLDFAQTQRKRNMSIVPDDKRLGYWQAFIERNGDFFPRFPLELGLEPDRMYPAVNESETLLDPWEAEALEAECRAAGGSMFMGLLAAVAVSLRNQGGPSVYRGFMPVSERGRGGWERSIGWFVNTLPIEFPVSADLGLRELMGSADVPFVRAWQLLAPEYFALRSWPVPVNFFSYLDTRRFAGAEHHADWRTAAHVWASGVNGTCSWFQRDEAGLHTNTIFADTLRARRTMAGVQGELRDTLREMCRAKVPC